MTTNETYTLIIRDQAGAWYAVTDELLAAARMTAEQQAELQRSLATDDVSGYWTPITIPLPDPNAPDARPTHLAGVRFQLLGLAQFKPQPGGAPLGQVAE